MAEGNFVGDELSLICWNYPDSQVASRICEAAEETLC